ncbi:putative bifunctional diguanylate cyclase/phosphodiesterase [Pseudobutyrivibrio sp.]|uniref:putative bifunctional diguanylate cyclase/phosphodiesterase n=1 Tax=Pseudobutyrivibrio sp. TaxID=2014367 RepID=UPI001DBE402C|nr:EAL domain-containing protein [Pseudobutyrivibrio sp.]MBE5911844.1 EAL domain-containing protein [Pseudobutyrivibrio sp.]
MDSNNRVAIELEVNNEAMQSLQDSFCKANNLYLMCVGKSQGQLTTFSGTKPEENFVDYNFTAELRREIIDSFVDGNVENVIERYGTEEYLLYRGVAIRGGAGECIGVWLCFGVDKEKLPIGIQLPEEIRLTTADSFDKSISLIENLTKHYFAEKIKAQALKLKLSDEKQAEIEIESRLKKNEIMTEILRDMESEDSFADIANNILGAAGRYLECTNTALLQINPDGVDADMICEWVVKGREALSPKFKQVPVISLPFMNGKPYTISSDAVLPELFEVFFIKHEIKAGIFLPINVNDSAAMYLCFISRGQERKWSVEDLRFANDIKRILHSVLLKKITANSLASSYSALEAILQNAGYGVVVADLDTKDLLYKNETFSRMFDNEIDRLAIEEIIFDKRYTLSEINGYSANGSGKWFDISIAAIEWVDGREVRLLTFYDTTELRLYQKKVEKQAQEDVLTGLYNRQACEKDISLEFHVAKKLNKEFAVLMLDLDDFASVNEGLGYQIGDDLLEYIAHSINDISYINGKCYRVGGDEFAVIVDHANFKNLDMIIKRIMTLFDNPWTLNGQEYYCTVSMGCVKGPGDLEDSSAILTRLNIALHGAKNRGKNRFEFYDANSDAIVAEKVKLEQALRRAVEDGCKEFEVYYQPIMEFVNSIPTCCGAEALIRWNSLEYGLVLPDQFIPQAEKLKLINTIGQHVLEEATRSCKHWNDFGHPEYKVNVNLSVVQLTQVDFIDKLDEVLKETGINPNNLTLEVTESLAINDMDRMVAILEGIRSRGCRVALDDFGTGYSSLNYIRTMPLDTIKIDRAFVSDMNSDHFSELFVKTISELADSLDVDVCVEGVEFDKQIDMIGKFSVNLAQGFFFDKPLSKDDFESKYL